jgi:hypothetical protein
MTSKEENHPDLAFNGTMTLDYFDKDLGFNAREVVAIMGAHTIGRFHSIISLHRYTWKTRSGRLFNNGYYRNLAAKPMVLYPTLRHPAKWHDNQVVVLPGFWQLDRRAATGSLDSACVGDYGERRPCPVAELQIW